MDPRSEQNLLHVHPDLVKVIRAALQTPQPFVVIYGLRSATEEAALVAAHKSQTMHSRHLANAQGFACAVDVAALVNGQPNFAAGREMEVFGQIAHQVKDAASALNIQIQWGGQAVGAWIPGVVSTFLDWDHFQLSWSVYP